MKIESKYNVGDKVWFPYNNLYFEGKISKIIGWENEYENNKFLYEVKHVSLSDSSFEKCGEEFSERLYENELWKFEDKDLIINNLFVYE